MKLSKEGKTEKKRKKKKKKEKSNTFQGNKSPCDSDCLFNNVKQKKGQKKILLENCPIKIAENTFFFFFSNLFELIRVDHREVEI